MDKAKTEENEMISIVYDVDKSNNSAYEDLYKKLSPPSPNWIHFYSSEGLKHFVEILPDNEKRIIEEIFGLKEGTLPKSADEVAKELGLTKQTVMRNKKKTLDKLSDLVYHLQITVFTWSPNYRHSEYFTDEERNEQKEIWEALKTHDEGLIGDSSEIIEKLKNFNLEYVHRQEKTQENEGGQEQEIANEEQELTEDNENELEQEESNSEDQNSVEDNEEIEEEIVNESDNTNEEQDIVENEVEEQEEINLEDLTSEQLQEIISKNQKTIESNEKVLKQQLIQKILNQQKTISAQQKEIDELSNQKGEINE